MYMAPNTDKQITTLPTVVNFCYQTALALGSRHWSSGFTSNSDKILSVHSWKDCGVFFWLTRFCCRYYDYSQPISDGSVVQFLMEVEWNSNVSWMKSKPLWEYENINLVKYTMLSSGKCQIIFDTPWRCLMLLGRLTFYSFISRN